MGLQAWARRKFKPCGYRTSHTKYPEAATRGVLWKNVFFEISQNSQENIVPEPLF